MAEKPFPENMPLKKQARKRRNDSWFRKWLHRARIIFNLQRHGFQKPPPDIVFLTSKEIKDSLANTSKFEPQPNLVDSSDRPGPDILPQKNRLHKHTSGNRSFSGKLKELLHRISFGIFKKKHSSSSTSHHRSRHAVRPEVAANTDGNYLVQNKLPLKTGSSENQHEGKIPLHHRTHQHISRHRSKRISFRRIFKFFKKKPTNSYVLSPDSVEEPKSAEKLNVPWKYYITPTLTSTAMFMVAYQLSWFLYQLAVMITASYFDISSVLFYYEVMFPEGAGSPKWTPEKIIIITLAGPFLALVSWIVFRFVLRMKTRLGPHLRMFLVWMYLTSMMLFFGAFVGGAITLEGFGYVIDWLFMSIALRLILSLIFIGMIIMLSWKVVGYLPGTSRLHSYKNNRYKFVLSRLIIPWFVGAGIMTLLKLTNNIAQHEKIFDYDTINLATLVFAVVTPLFNSTTRPQLISHKKGRKWLKNSLSSMWITGAIVLVVLFRIVLSYGIYFKLIFYFKLNFYN